MQLTKAEQQVMQHLWEMGEGLVTGKRVSLESTQTDLPTGTQHGNSARWVGGWKRVYGE